MNTETVDVSRSILDVGRLDYESYYHYHINLDWLVLDTKITRYREIVKKIILPSLNVTSYCLLTDFVEDQLAKCQDSKLKKLLQKKKEYNERMLTNV